MLTVEQFPIPSYPVIFTKYAGKCNRMKHMQVGFPTFLQSVTDTLAGPYEDIPISPEAKNLDYEGELSVVIGKDAKNLNASDDPFKYVLGYTTGNDVSSRHWQNPQISGSQHGYAKSFDKFAPIGPVISSKVAIPDPGKLRLRTWVNGELRQDGSTDDLIFNVGEIIRHLSRGMTLRKGTVIMTGTPR
jgi:2-keto-4-pentenoate hydratase/2-oxohepta-3-ene-1,7-dioic acid hydratase in catechol pathway